MDFQPIESLAPYKDLIPPEDRASELERFVTEWLTPQLDRLNVLRREALHKVVFYDMGLVALGINSQLSSWIPRSERYRRQRKGEIVSAVRDRAHADHAAKTRKWTEATIKAQVDSELAVWDALVQSLKMVREDMFAIISFTQSSMRNIRNEELQGNIQS